MGATFPGVTAETVAISALIPGARLLRAPTRMRTRHPGEPTLWAEYTHTGL